MKVKACKDCPFFSGQWLADPDPPRCYAPGKDGQAIYAELDVRKFRASWCPLPVLVEPIDHYGMTNEWLQDRIENDPDVPTD